MSREVRITVFIFTFALGLLGLAAVYNIRQNAKTPDRILETFGRDAYDSTDAHGNTVEAGRVHTVSGFAFTDQTGRTVTEKDYAGKIYITDFFFTTCQSICPSMSHNMMKLADKYKGDRRIGFLSHTVDPEEDSVPVLAEYAARYQADPKQWQLVTGPKKALYDMARNQYYASVEKGDGGPDDFVHTQRFTLVDRDRHIRGFYDGTDSTEMVKLERDITLLLEEQF